jgi:hypothetical protein
VVLTGAGGLLGMMLGWLLSVGARLDPVEALLHE